MPQSVPLILISVNAGFMAGRRNGEHEGDAYMDLLPAIFQTHSLDRGTGTWMCCVNTELPTAHLLPILLRICPFELTLTWTLNMMTGKFLLGGRHSTTLPCPMAATAFFFLYHLRAGARRDYRAAALPRRACLPTHTPPPLPLPCRMLQGHPHRPWATVGTC